MGEVVDRACRSWASGRARRPVFGKTIDLSELLTPLPETAIVEIAGDADGTAAGFGIRLHRALEPQSGDLLHRASDGKLIEVVYTDRYVFSPLSALLAAELIGGFRPALGCQDYRPYTRDL